MKISISNFIVLAMASLAYLALSMTGIILITPLHSSIILLIFASTVLVIPVCLMWREVYDVHRTARLWQTI